MSDVAVQLRASYEVPKLALSIKEACAALGITWDLWREHVEPEVRLVRLGRRRLVPVAELQRWLAEHAELDGVGR
jgi:excisionase family DNA binding protein